jgi:hypothetical protein
MTQGIEPAQDNESVKENGPVSENFTQDGVSQAVPTDSQSYGKTEGEVAQAQEPEPPVRKLQPKVDPVTVQRLGRRELASMIRDTAQMSQEQADAAIDATLGVMSDWISAMIGALEPGQRASLSIPGWGTLALTFAPKTDDKQWRINAGLPAPYPAITFTYRPTKPQAQAIRSAERSAKRRMWALHLLHTPPIWPRLWGWNLQTIRDSIRSVDLPVPPQADTRTPALVDSTPYDHRPTVSM